jgi:hypothetical protein
MGCQQSRPDNNKDAVGATRPIQGPGGGHRTAGIGATERLISAQLRRQKDQMQASNRSTNSRSTSLEADEDTTGVDKKMAPKLNADGTLSAEEVAKRSSGSIETATAKLGNAEKGGQVLTVHYAFTKRRGYYPDSKLESDYSLCAP